MTEKIFCVVTPRALGEAVANGLVGEGATPVNMTPSMLGQGAGVPMAFDVMSNFLRGKDGWAGTPDHHDE